MDCTKRPPKRVVTSKSERSMRITVWPSRTLSSFVEPSSLWPKSRVTRRVALPPGRRGHGSRHLDPLTERPHETILARDQPVRAGRERELNTPIGVRQSRDG